MQRAHTQVVTENSDIKLGCAAVERALELVSPVRLQDAAVVFVAMHGFSDAAGNYYLVLRKAWPGNLQGLEKTRSATSLLPGIAQLEALRGTARRRLLIVDACQAHNIGGCFEAHSLMTRPPPSLYSLNVAAKGEEGAA